MQTTKRAVCVSAVIVSRGRHWMFYMVVYDVIIVPTNRRKRGRRGVINTESRGTGILLVFRRYEKTLHVRMYK